MSRTPSIWKEDFKVHSYEIGASGFVTPQAICRFMQEAASNHAAALDVSAEEVEQLQQMWVLAQLSLRMRHYPRWHQTLHLETWPVATQSAVRGNRDFVLKDERQRELGIASTTWLLLNRQTRRSLRLPQGLFDVAMPPRATDILHAPKACDLPGGYVVSAATGDAAGGAGVTRMEFRIRASDIDWNMHVNNVCYLEWALEGVPAEFRLANQVSQLDILVLAEGRYGSTVLAETFAAAGQCKRTAQTDGTASDDDAAPCASESDFYLHRICELESAQVLGLLRTGWQAKAR